MDDRGPELSSIHELLDEQLSLIQQTLSFNRAIAKRATGDKLLALADTCRRSASMSRSPSSPATIEQQPKLSTPDLAQPLLQHQGCGFGREASAASAPYGTLVRLMKEMPDRPSLRSRAGDIRSRCRGAADRLLGGLLENPDQAKASCVGSPSPDLSPTEVDPEAKTVEQTKESGKSHGEDLKELRKTVHHLLFKSPRDDNDDDSMYKDKGLWQKIARNSAFKNTTFAMITLSTLWLAIDTDYNKTDILCNAPPVFQVVDNVICVYFLAELLIRWFAHRPPMRPLFDLAFVLDLLLVVMMVLDTWVKVLLYQITGKPIAHGNARDVFQAFRNIRLLRILRVFRMNRLFRSVPDLMVFVQGMSMAVRSVLTTLLMLLLVTYTFAIIFTQLYSDSPGFSDKFGSVLVSTNYLLLAVLAGWSADDFTSLLEKGAYVGYLLLLCYLLIGSLTIMNMLVGILVDVVQTCAASQDEESALKELKQNIVEIAAITDRDGDNTVTAFEFHSMLRNPDAIQKLYHGGVNVLALADFADFFFRDIDEMNMEEFIEAILQFRGNRGASGKDVVDLRVHMSQELARLSHAASLLPK